VLDKHSPDFSLYQFFSEIPFIHYPAGKRNIMVFTISGIYSFYQVGTCGCNSKADKKPGPEKKFKGSVLSNAYCLFCYIFLLEARAGHFNSIRPSGIFSYLYSNSKWRKFLKVA
jgi:hypothetical protein